MIQRVSRIRWASLPAALPLMMVCGWPCFVRADELTEAMPAETLLYVYWPGADTLGETTAETAWGKLLAEPEIEQFRQQWRAAIWPAIDRQIRKELNGQEVEAYDAGMELLSTVWKHPTALGFAGVDMTPEGPRADVALVVQAGAEAEAMAGDLETLLKTAMGPAFESRPVKAGDATLHEVTLPEVGIPLQYGVLGERLVVSIGTRFPAHWAAEDAADITSSERFAAAMKAVGGSAETPIFYLDLDGTVAMLEKFQPMFAAMEIPILGEPDGVRALLKNVGLGTLRSFSAAMRPEAGGFVTTTFLHAPNLKEGAGEVLAQKLLTEAELKVVPRDVTFATVSNFDLAGAWRAVMSAVEAVAPEAYAKFMPELRAFETRIGVRIEEDLLGAFGDTWALYDAPENAGFWFTGIVAVGELRPDNRLDETIAKLVRAANEAAEEEALRIYEETYHGRTIRYIHMPGLPIPISPAWAAVNDRVVMGLFPQMVRAGIDHLANPGPTLLDNPDFQRGLKQMPEQYSAISYTDTRDGARFLYSLALPLSVAGVNMGLGEDIPLNAGLLPSSRTVTRHLFGNVSASTTTEEGVLSVSYGAIPISIPAFSGSGGVASTAMMASIMLPSLARARELAKRTTGAAQLSGIAKSCLTYAVIYRGTLPPDLETLTEGGERAYISKATLKSPRDSTSAEVSYVYIKGQTNLMDPRNIVAYEDPDLHDTSEGLNVAFLDGHVEWMSMEEFQKRLEETKERIAKASEQQ